VKTLSQYLAKHGISQGTFAHSLGCSKGLVWQWINGRTKMSARYAVKIERVTAREVKRQDLMPELYRGMST